MTLGDITSFSRWALGSSSSPLPVEMASEDFKGTDLSRVPIYAERVNVPKNAAGRSQAHADALASVLVPDVMVADLSKDGPAAYLGVETGGATGNTFGGRKPSDDAVDISLGAIFGTTLSDLGLVEPDGNEIPSLTSDNVGPKYSKSDTFPYLRPPVTP